MAKIKQQIQITKPQSEFLLLEAGKLNISVSDLIRRILDHFIESKNSH